MQEVQQGKKQNEERERERQKKDPRQADEKRGEHTFSAGYMYNVYGNKEPRS